MKHLKKIISSILIMALSITLVSPSYAGGLWDSANSSGANGTGGGHIHTVSTERDVGVLHLFHINQGFRVYIVDKQGLPVSNSVDFVKYRPWDMQAAFGQDTYEVVQKMWNDWYDVTGIWDIPKEKIIYLNGAKTDGVFIQSPGAINRDGSIPSNTKGVMYVTREKQEDTIGGDDTLGLYYSPGKMYQISDLEMALRTWISQDYGSWKITGASKDHISYIHPATGEELDTFNKIVAPIEEAPNSTTAGIIGTGEEMKNLMIMNLSEDYDEDNMTVLKYFISMSMPDVDGRGIPINGGALTPLFHYTDSKVQSKYDELYMKADDEGRKYAIIETMRELGLKVAFEPVAWSIPEIVSSQLTPVKENFRDYIWSAKSIIYGSPTNVAHYSLGEFNAEYIATYPDTDMPNMVKDKGSARLREYLLDNDTSFDWQWGLLTYAYRIVQDIPEYKMKAFTDDMMIHHAGNFDVLCDSKNRIGYGVMYFNIDLEAGTSTHTWDNTTYPENNYKPGPAPQTTNDDGSFPTEFPSEGEEYKEKDHKFNIIKFYGEKQEDNSVVYTENHTRENTVHNIKIEDEVDYKVNGWFTSPEYKEPVSDDESYDDYKSTLQKGLEGDKSGHVTIPADSADTTLYVKLVKEKTEEETEGPGNPNQIILHEDELSYPYSMQDLKE